MNGLFFNWVDLIFLVIIIYFIATNKGFIDTLIEIISLILAIILSYKTYTYFGYLINVYFGIPKGIANALGFFSAWIIIESIFNILYTLLIIPSLHFFRKNPINHYLGYFAAIIQAAIIYLFLVSFVFALPVKPVLKRDIIESASGHYFINLSQNIDRKINKVFNEAILETINFLTIKPDSGESVDLKINLTEKQMSIDNQSEAMMLNLVNQERKKNGLSDLAEDDRLRDLSRNYAKEMLINGFFSHVSKVDNSTPAVRASRNNVYFNSLGENLAYAPDVYIAHQGLMNSPGHRANILSPDFNHIGIGVIDAGIYGKMFVQEFSD